MLYGLSCTQEGGPGESDFVMYLIWAVDGKHFSAVGAQLAKPPAF